MGDNLRSMYFTFVSVAVDLYLGKGKEFACFFFEGSKIIKKIKNKAKCTLRNLQSLIKYSAPDVYTHPLNQAQKRQGLFGRNWVNRPCCFQECLVWRGDGQAHLCSCAGFTHETFNKKSSYHNTR